MVSSPIFNEMMAKYRKTVSWKEFGYHLNEVHKKDNFRLSETCIAGWFLQTRFKDFLVSI